MSRSKVNHPISVQKRTDVGRLPLFLEMGHRQLEKGQPDGVVAGDFTMCFTVPVDILRLSKISEGLLNGIEEITFFYSKSKT